MIDKICQYLNDDLALHGVEGYRIDRGKMLTAMEQAGSISAFTQLCNAWRDQIIRNKVEDYHRTLNGLDPTGDHYDQVIVFENGLKIGIQKTLAMMARNIMELP